jgi:hypothetical protein
VLSGKISKLSTMFVFFISPDSTPYRISGVLRDRCQSKSESVFKVLPLFHCVLTMITSSLFVGFERMSSESKVNEVSYKFGITSFRR